MEILAALLAGQRFGTRIEARGEAARHSLRTLLPPLRARGAQIAGKSSDDGNLTAPVAVAPLLAHEQLAAAEIDIPSGDAATKRALLISGLFTRGVTAVHEGLLSRDHTERALGALGAPIQTLGPLTMLDTSEAAPRWPGFHWELPGDFSLAAYVIAAALATPGSDVRIEQVGLNRSRTAFLDCLRHAGAAVSLTPKGDCAGDEPVGDIRVRASGLRGIRALGELSQRLLDDVPAFLALAAACHGRIALRDVGALRLRAGDPLKQSALLLRAFGAECTEYEDGVDVERPNPLAGASLPVADAPALKLLGLTLGLAAAGETQLPDAGRWMRYTLNCAARWSRWVPKSRSESPRHERASHEGRMSPTSTRSSGQPVVAIDGPAGAGKSTAARELAERLGYVLVDTGALYRGVALAAHERGVDWDDAAALGSLVAQLSLQLTRDAQHGVKLIVDGADRSAGHPHAAHLDRRQSRLAPPAGAHRAARTAAPAGSAGWGGAGGARHRHGGVSRRRGEDLPHRQRRSARATASRGAGARRARGGAGAGAGRHPRARRAGQRARHRAAARCSGRRAGGYQRHRAERRDRSPRSRRPLKIRLDLGARGGRGPRREVVAPWGAGGGWSSCPRAWGARANTLGKAAPEVAASVLGQEFAMRWLWAPLPASWGGRGRSDHLAPRAPTAPRAGPASFLAWVFFASARVWST